LQENITAGMPNTQPQNIKLKIEHPIDAHVSLVSSFG
jgi:hypothetical protein